MVLRPLSGRRPLQQVVLRLWPLLSHLRLAAAVWLLSLRRGSCLLTPPPILWQIPSRSWALWRHLWQRPPSEGATSPAASLQQPVCRGEGLNLASVLRPF